MSDFLSHLAAKNLNLVPVIQPRPLSLFEPVVPRTAPGLGPHLDHNVLDISDSVESYVPRTVPTMHRPTVAAEPAPIDPQARSDEPRLRQTPLTLPPRLESPAIALQLEQRREGQREIINVTNIRSVVEQPIVHAPSSERVVIEKEASFPDRTAPSIGIENAIQAATHEEPLKVTPHPIVTPVIERIVQERERTAPSQAQRSDQVAHHTLPPIATQPTAIEPPTIHVTIGRIEVRAIPPAAPAKRSTPSSSALSLDDYLRARDGGKR
jgi:hypothetical protein